MDRQEPLTCGQGLAHNSVLPEKLGKLMAAMAQVLEDHTKALDLTDANSAREYDAYQSLVGELREIGAQLAATAKEMVGYRDLPMGRHDPEAMAHPRVRESFETFVKRKQELLALLQESAEEDQQLLAEMKSW